MNPAFFRPRSLFTLLGAALLALTSVALNAENNEAGTSRWVATWAAAPQACEPNNGPGLPNLAGHTLRQYIRVTLGGKKFQLRLSNEFCKDPVVIRSGAVARAEKVGTNVPGSAVRLTFNDKESVTLQPGSAIVSDPFELETPDLSLLAISLFFDAIPELPTAHPGSRTTSYIASGDHTSADTLPSPHSTDHWYVISGLTVQSAEAIGTIAFLGDSITDGRGSTTNGNDRWPDQYADLFFAQNKSAKFAMINLGIGGNRLLRDGLGPHALARFDRDIIAQPAVHSVVLFEGINDIGTGVGARKQGRPYATADDLILAYQQIAVRAKAQGLKVYACTILPFEGAGYYSPEAEEIRQALNNWIRQTKSFDGIIDFDRVMQDPSSPGKLKADLHMGDWLHPNQAGYRVMAEAIHQKLSPLLE